MEGTRAIGWANMFYVTPTLILLAGLVDDLKSQKVHNWLVVVLLVIASMDTFASSGLTGLTQGGLASITAIGIFLPLVALKVVGAGDMKLMIAFGLASQPSTILWMTLYSIIWGALLGIIKILLAGKFTQLYVNISGLLNKNSVDKSQFTKIPFTVALLFGWLTYLVLKAGVQ